MRTRSVVVVGVCVVAMVTALVAAALSTHRTAPAVGARGAHAVPPEPRHVSRIDRPAEDVVVPPDAAVNVVTAFGARGDGVADDTAALQSAISAGVGLANSRRVLFLPAGTYRLTAPLVWRDVEGKWGTGVTLWGANRDKVVLRLDDHAPGFSDTRSPRPVVMTGSQDSISDDGEGNEAFDNNLFDLTVDVGQGNPGAIGVDYLASNRGAMRNVVVRAGRGSGRVGISMTRRWPGPCLLQDVRVSGFATGVALNRWDYGVTAEHLRLENQREVGLSITGNVLSARDVVSRNSVPAVRSDNPVGADSLLVLDGARLLGGAPSEHALVLSGSASLRNVLTEGYGADVLDATGSHWLSARPTWTVSPNSEIRPGGNIDDENAEVLDATPPPLVGGSDWVSARDFGAVPDDGRDDTGALQAALDSGRSVVTLGAGRYQVDQTLQVPSSVTGLVGFGAVLEAVTGSFEGSSTKGVLSVQGSGATPFTLQFLSFHTTSQVVAVERVGGRPVHLMDLHLDGVPVGGVPGRIFLTNVEGGSAWSFSPGDQVWARQLNAEQPGTKILSDGADLWVLGLKTEGHGTVVQATNGGKIRVLGGLLMPGRPSDVRQPAFEAEAGARLDLTFAVSALDPARGYDVMSQQRCQGATVRLRREDVDRRGAAGALVLDYIGDCARP